RHATSATCPRPVRLPTRFVRFFTAALRPPTATRFPYPTLFRSGIPVVKWTSACGSRWRSQVGVCRPGPAVQIPGADQSQGPAQRSEEHTSELQSREKLVCRLLLDKKKLLEPSATHTSTRSLASR